MGKETNDDYNARLLESLEQWLFKHWPYENAVIVEEKTEDVTEYHLIDRWCHIKSSQYMSDLVETDTPLQFEYDTYKLLLKYVEKNPLESSFLSMSD